MHVLKLFGISKASDCLEHFQIIRKTSLFETDMISVRNEVREEGKTEI